MVSTSADGWGRTALLFHASACFVLREYPHVRTVVTSTWRLRRSLDVLKAFFHADVRDQVVGMTPVKSGYLTKWPHVNKPRWFGWVFTSQCHPGWRWMTTLWAGLGSGVWCFARMVPVEPKSGNCVSCSGRAEAMIFLCGDPTCVQLTGTGPCMHL